MPLFCVLPLLEPFHLRWLEEPVIPDDTRGYAELKRYGRVPIAGGEHEFTIFGFRELLENNALDYIQFDTNRVGGISQARKISALAESFQVPPAGTSIAGQATPSPIFVERVGIGARPAG